MLSLPLLRCAAYILQAWTKAAYLPSHRERVQYIGGAEAFTRAVLSRVGSLLELSVQVLLLLLQSTCAL
jgi:hypothetical protein